jgi:hypothetical protein
MDFSRALAALMASRGRATSISFLCWLMVVGRDGRDLQQVTVTLKVTVTSASIAQGGCLHKAARGGGQGNRLNQDFGGFKDAQDGGYATGHGRHGNTPYCQGRPGTILQIPKSSKILIQTIKNQQAVFPRGGRAAHSLLVFWLKRSTAGRVTQVSALTFGAQKPGASRVFGAQRTFLDVGTSR